MTPRPDQNDIENNPESQTSENEGKVCTSQMIKSLIIKIIITFILWLIFYYFVIKWMTILPEDEEEAGNGQSGDGGRLFGGKIGNVRGSELSF